MSENSIDMKFTSTTMMLGEVLEGGKADVKFPFEGDKKDIVVAIPQCGCTAEIQINDDSVTAVYTTDTAEKLRTADKGIFNKYPSGKIPFGKGITLYLNDGLDLKIINDRGISVYNPEKEKVFLNFSGYTDISAYSEEAYKEFIVEKKAEANSIKDDIATE